MSLALPMESNPDTMNKYLLKLGVSEKWRMVDVIGLESDALAWVPRPVLAVVLLFPLSEIYEQLRRKEENNLVNKEPPKDVFHLRQVLSNVCGTIALVHSVANNTHNIELKEGPLKKYLKDAEGLDAAAKGALLENSTAILEAYKDIVHTGSSVPEESNEDPSNHFVTFIHKDGTLFELDGRKTFPINHGPTTPESLLEDAAKVCREFMARDPDNIGFNVVALVPSL
ncbi:ubiquitin carboxyl-terminal hydrolase-like [Achroia grisella]|uniref:ubiquitin carboxyl-terminal hydrolase-like n=1 Tax=Achroia grisella TaxID=688607 RepID=UPI0027D2CC8B|nr:ubiquitin carboxyl-terminal hydrolase-like [Achroia grisella]